jgi:nucleoside-diphosphate kinase
VPASSSNMATVMGGLVVFGAAATAWNTSAVARCDAIPVEGIPGTNQERTFLAVKPDGVQVRSFGVLVLGVSRGR